ncbi:MAG TPA: ammonium transporter, partial [Candidatus Methylacidiphilales bacterium]
AVGSATEGDKTVTWTSNLSIGPGHNAWMMTSAALVLFMTLPGLALFYGGLVRRKNVLSVLAQCFLITGIVSILWWVCGYSLAFHNSADSAPAFLKGVLGSLDQKFFAGVSSTPNTGYSAWAGENVFAMFQLMFAIITPALIVGAIAERVKFTAIAVFMTLWMFLVYFPMAHMVWGGDGLMNGVWNASAKIHAIDFAGGTVVHMTSGYSALIFALIVGKRLGFGTQSFAPHSVVLCFVGTGMLWVGWYGFNAGSACAADVISANAFTTTTLATAFASFVWAALEFIFKKKASVLGFCSGAVAGLVVITPACGFVNTTGAAWIGLAAGAIPFFAVTFLKPLLGYDDALDTFGVHAIGGTVGAILTGVLADPTVNPNLNTNLKDLVANHTLVYEQLKAVGVTITISVVMTAIIAFAIKFTIGLRPTPEQESQGLDIVDHGEEGYIL